MLESLLLEILQDDDAQVLTEVAALISARLVHLGFLHRDAAQGPAHWSREPAPIPVDADINRDEARALAQHGTKDGEAPEDGARVV